MEEKSCEGVVRGIWTQRHPGGTQEVFRRPTGSSQEIPRRSQQAPRRHPGGTQEAPRGTRSTRDAFQVKCAKTIVFYSKNDAGDDFRVDGSDVTITKSAACAQK